MADQRTQPSLTDQEATAALAAMAHPTRLAILGWLKHPDDFPPQLAPATEVGVCLKHLQARAGVSQSTASQYLSVLHRAGLVTATRIGQRTHYRRDDGRIAAVAAYLATQA